MTEWEGPQWVMLCWLTFRMFLAIIGKPMFQWRGWEDYIGWLFSTGSNLGIIIGLLIWGDFF